MDTTKRQYSNITSEKASSPWVVIPTYNEKMNIERMIHALFELNIPNLNVLIVDDSSPDGTGQTVKNLQSNYSTLHLRTRQKKEGLGRAYIDGFSYAQQHGAKSIVQMDADFSHDPQDIPHLLEGLKKNDLILGSRYANGISVINWPLSRLLLSTFANIYVDFITGMPFKDTTGGFRAWRSSTLSAIDVPTVQVDGYGFQIAMLHRVWRKKLKIKEIPIIFTERREGQSKMSKAIMWEAVLLVWKLRLSGK